MTEEGLGLVKLRAPDPLAARRRLAADLCSIETVARSIGMSLHIVYFTECRCRGLLEIEPDAGLFVCAKCGKRGDSVALVQLIKWVSQEEALCHVEALAAGPSR